MDPPFPTPFTSSSPPPSPASVSSSSCSSSFSSVPYSPSSSSSSSSSSTVSEEDGYEYEDGSARDGGGWAVPQPVRGWGAGAGAGGVEDEDKDEEVGFRPEEDDSVSDNDEQDSSKEDEEETKEEHQHQDIESLDVRLAEEIVSPSSFSSSSASSSSASSSSSSWSSLSSNSIHHTGNLNNNSTGPGASESMRVIQRTRRQGMCPPPLMFGGRGPVLGAPGYGYFGSGGSGELPTSGSTDGDELDEKTTKKKTDEDTAIENQKRNMNGNRSKSVTRSRKEEEFEKELLETVLALENSFMEPVRRAAASSSSFLDGSQNLSCFAVSLKSLAASSGSLRSGGNISRTPSPINPPPGLPLPPVPTTGLPVRPSLKRRPSAFISSQAAFSGTSPNEGPGVGLEVLDLPSNPLPPVMSVSTAVSLPAQPSHSIGIPNTNTNTNTNTRRSGASHAPLRPSQLRKTSLGASSTMKTTGVPPVPSLPLPPLPLPAVPSITTSTSTSTMTTVVASERGDSSDGRQRANGGDSESLVPTKTAAMMMVTKTKNSASAPNPNANDPSNNSSASESKSGILKVKPPVTGTSGTGTANSNSGGHKPFLPGDVRPMSASTRKKLQEFEVGPRLLNERARRSKGVGLGLTNVGGLFPVSLAPASATGISEISIGGYQRQRLDVKLTKEHIVLRRKMQVQGERERIGVGFGQRF